MKHTNKHSNIAAYGRTNTKNTQQSFCGSINQQLKGIKYWAKFNNCRIIANYHDECVSGNSENPAGLIQLGSDIWTKQICIECVVVCDYSRVSRNSEMLNRFEKLLMHNNVKIVSVSQPQLSEKDKFANKAYLAIRKKTNLHY